MKRRALIITSPLTPDNASCIPGVLEDAKNFRNYLKSVRGGAWKDDEIVTMRNPTSQSLYKYLKDINISRPDIFMLVFSGHGYISAASGNDVLLINDKQEIPVSHLETDAIRQINIFDACRKIRFDEDFSHYNDIGIGDIDIPAPAHHLKLSRSIYNTIISKMPAGILDFYSTSIDDYSFVGQNGSSFISALINAACNEHIDRYFLTAYSLFKTTHKYLDNDQLPELYYDHKQSLKFPLAIKIDPVLTSLDEQVRRRRKEEWQLVGLLGATLVLANL